ncbi:hypothetical protein [Microbacterium sp. LMI1-1-1.1]|uniref:TY-Chap2 family putative peptide chaperone n=1 Tax=Microbacterium sp. LMI1-1-1.1 TaxID=3135223 RepID=UPI003465BE1E
MSSNPQTVQDESPWGTTVPAQRFVIEQSWWVCSELVRRHPDHVVYETHPGGGLYDILLVRPARNLRDRDATILINRGGTVRVSFHRTDNSIDQIDVCHSAAALAQPSAHSLVKMLESAARLEVTAKAPSSTPRSLAFRMASTALTALLNERGTWDWRQIFCDTSGEVPAVLNYLEAFPSARAEVGNVELEPWDWGVPEAHYWALLRDGEPAAVVSTEGVLHLRDGSRVELASAYASRDRNIHRLVSDFILARVL